MANKAIPNLNPASYRTDPNRKWTVSTVLDKESAGCLLEFSDQIGAGSLSEALRAAVIVAAGKNVTVSAVSLMARDRATREMSQWLSKRVMTALAEISQQVSKMADNPSVIDNDIAVASGEAVAYVMPQEEIDAAEIERTNLATLKGEF